MTTVVGIDIGASAVKVAVLRTTYRKTSFAALVAVDVAQAGSPADAVRSAVFAALAGKPASHDGIATAIEGARVGLRTVSLPASVQRQLGDVLAFELESQVPFEMSEAVFDYRVLAPRLDREGDDLQVLTAVARASDVAARIEMMKSAIGQEPERVGVGAFPLAALTPFIPALMEDGPIVVIDLGTTSSEVLFLRAGEPVFGRTLSYGTEGLPASAPRLAREIRTTIASFRSSGAPAPVRVFLCGGGAHVSGAEGFLAGELELPVEALPAPGIEMGELPPDQANDLARFAKAIGLALSLTPRGAGLNLRRGPLAFERGFAWVKDKLPMLAGLAAVIFVSFSFSAWARLHALSTEHDALEGALGIVTKDVLGEETTEPDRAEDLLAQASASIDDDPMPHGDAFDVMDKLSEDIPQSMVHDVEDFDFQKGHSVVHGIVGTIPDAQSIATSLQGERCFDDVKVVRTTQVVGGDRQKYVMEFDLKCPEDVKAAPKKKGESAAASATASGSAGAK
jgi:general secretion pathway protein L